MHIARGLVASALVVAVTLIVAACASTRITSEWTAPSIAPTHFKSIVIFGISQQTTTRRLYEDEFVKQLAALGIEGKQSYLYLPNEGKADEGAIKMVVQKAGCDAAIVTRLVRIQQKTETTPGYYQPVVVGSGFYGSYSSAWAGGFYDAPTSYEYDVYSTETSLFDLHTDKLIWSALARTTEPSNQPQAVAEYVTLMIDAMKEKGLL